MALPISDDTPPDPPAKRKPQRPDWLVGANEGLEAEIARSEEQEKSAPPTLGRKEQEPAPSRLPDLDEAHGPIIPHPARRVELPGGLSADVWGTSAAPGDLSGELESGPPAPRAAAGYEAAVERTPPPPSRPAYIMEPHPIREGKFPLNAPAVEPKITIRPSLRQQLTKVGNLLRPALPWVAGAMACGFAVMFLLRALGVGTTSVRSILKNPGRWDGQAVRVRGRVGDDVFPLGAGSSFYLLQGRDTLVVFSRSRVPAVHEPLEIPGIVSSGVLNGTLRPALLEQVGKR